MAYTVLSAALARCKERCQASEADDTYITELLEMSKASTKITDPPIDLVIHYRPFYCAAKMLAQNPDIRDLSEATGEAKFTLAQPRIDDLMALQLSYDTANNLDVPKGFEATVVVGTSMTSSLLVPQGTTTIDTTVQLF